MIQIFELLLTIWPYLVSTLLFMINLSTTLHIILYKQQIRAAIGWIGLTWLSPGLGAILYFLFGINRIQRKAQKKYEVSTKSWSQSEQSVEVAGPNNLPKNLRKLNRSIFNLTGIPLTAGNKIIPLIDGDRVYKQMLTAIKSAQKTISLSTYIFNRDRLGKKFINQLIKASERGLKLHVLIDDIGAKYSFPSVIGIFRKNGISCQRFMKSLLPWHMRYYNLRNHRKIMVVDGKLGFTGGINISEAAMQSLNPRNPISDLHFQLTGPIVQQLQKSFADDWFFCSNQRLQGEEWFPELQKTGQIMARGISDGPDENYNRLEYSLQAAISCAENSIKIITPYFLPGRELIRSLKIAALKDIEVELILPEQGNLKMVEWASRSYFSELLERGIKLYLSPPPFDHTKLMLVDSEWSLLGSANWDPRSLKLNFEFNVEAYSSSLNHQLTKLFSDKKKRAIKLTNKQLENRSFWRQLRNRSFRLLSPYL